MMKLSAIFICLMTSFSVVSAVRVGFDGAYDDSQRSLDTVTCSDGENGLITKGYTTLGSLPSFPNLTAAQAIASWNSPECGSCWQISYQGDTVNVTAIDQDGDGFNLSLEAMNSVTKGDGVELGIIDAEATQIDPKYCGL